MTKKLKLLFRVFNWRTLVLWLAVTALVSFAVYNFTGSSIFTSEVSAQSPVGGGGGSGVLQVQSSGGLADAVGCDLHVGFGVPADDTTKVITGQASKTVYICALGVSTAAAGTLAVVSGTGTDCGTGQAYMTAIMVFAQGHPLQLGSGLGYIMKAPVAEDVCITTGGGTSAGFVISHAIF